MKRKDKIDKTFVQELVSEHNKIRNNPKIYIKPLERLSKIIRKNNILHMDNERPFKTIEGKEAIDEAINYLESISEDKIKILSKNKMRISTELCEASKDHAKDIGFNGKITHLSSENKLLNDRIDKYCDWLGGLTESLDFSTINVKNIMLKLLICDGDKERKQREYIFNPGLLCLGAAHYFHIIYNRVNVITYGAIIIQKGKTLHEKEMIQNYLFAYQYFIKDKPEEKIDYNIIMKKKKSSNSVDDKDKSIIDEKSIIKNGIKIKQIIYSTQKGYLHILEEKNHEQK